MGRRKLLFSLIVLCLFLIGSGIAQSQEITSNKRFVTCEAVETKDSVYIVPNMNYLKNSDYWKWVLSPYGKRKKFQTISEAVSYMGKFGWNNVREYTTKDKKQHVIVLQKEYTNFTEYND